MPTYVHGSGGGGLSLMGQKIQKIVNPQATTEVKKGYFLKTAEDNFTTTSLKLIEDTPSNFNDTVQLSENRVLLCYRTVNQNQLVATVLTQTGKDIAIASKHIVASAVNITEITIAKLTDTKVVVCYRINGESIVVARVLEINGTSITVGAPKTVTTYSTTTEADSLSVTRSNDTTALLFFRYGAGTSGYCSIIETNGNEISAATSLQVVTKAFNCKSVSTFDDIHFLFYTDANNTLKCSCVEVFGRSISVYNTLDIDINVVNIEAISLTDRNIVVCYRDSVSNKGMIALIYYSSGVKLITKVEATNIIDAHIGMVRVNDKKFILVYKNSTNTFAKIITLNGNSFGIGKIYTAINKDARYISISKSNETDNIMVCQNYSESSKLICNILTTNSFVDLYNGDGEIYGVAMSNGYAGQTVDVIVP